MGNLIDVSKFDKIISVLPNYASIDKLQSIEGGGGLRNESLEWLELERVKVLRMIKEKWK